jgi:uncharacterized membrane protein (UPF0127 family)
VALRVTNPTRGTTLADRAREATGFWDRLKGLMGQQRLDPGDGLLITPCNSIHTFFMRIPIDAVFLDPAGVVVKILPAMVPWRVSGIYAGARSVLELPAGTAASCGTEAGDALQLEPTGAQPKTVL